MILSCSPMMSKTSLVLSLSLDYWRTSVLCANMSMTEEQLDKYFRIIDDELSQILAWLNTIDSIFRTNDIAFHVDSTTVGGIGRTFVRSARNSRRVFQYVKREYPSESIDHKLNELIHEVEIELVELEGVGKELRAVDQFGVNDYTITKELADIRAKPINRAALRLHNMLHELKEKLESLDD